MKKSKRRICIEWSSKNSVILTTSFMQKKIYFSNKNYGDFIDFVSLKLIDKDKFIWSDYVFYAEIVDDTFDSSCSSEFVLHVYAMTKETYNEKIGDSRFLNKKDVYRVTVME